MPEGQPALDQRGELGLRTPEPPGDRVGGVDDTPLRGGRRSGHGALLSGLQQAWGTRPTCSKATTRH